MVSELVDRLLLVVQRDRRHLQSEEVIRAI